MEPSESQFTYQGDFEPAYLSLHRSGELARRAETAVERLRNCRSCPRDCQVNRLENEVGVCKIGRYAYVSSFFAHPGEENCLRGWRGSGTIFFAMCNLGCVFCQNSDISHFRDGREVAPQELARMMISLQEQGCHNINFVTPEHVVPQIIEALPHAVEMGLKLPLVYNTSAYDALDSLQLMDGIIDIYMPDFKFFDQKLARRYLRAADYPQIARTALIEMQRQVGDLTFDDSGLALRGVLVRHLVMPGHLDDTRQIMSFLRDEVSPHIFVNIMAQYRPAGLVDCAHYTELNRALSRSEFLQAIDIALEEGIYRLDNRRRWF